jgi:hypothetical protein
MLENQGFSGVPSSSTINAIFKRNNLISTEASLAATPHKRFEKDAANIMWQADFKGHYTPHDMLDADRQRQEYRRFYNEERPHHALGLDTPSQHYRPSERCFPEKITRWEYDNEYQTRKIKDSGYLTFEGQRYFLSEAYAGKTVAIKPSSVDGFVNLYFRQFRIGRIDTNIPLSS